MNFKKQKKRKEKTKRSSNQNTKERTGTDCFKLQMNDSLADWWVLEFDTKGMQVENNFMGF